MSSHAWGYTQAPQILKILPMGSINIPENQHVFVFFSEDSFPT